MDPSNLFSSALTESTNLLRSSASVYHQSLQGYTTEDIAQEATIKILRSPSFPDINQNYIATAVRSVVADLRKKLEIPTENPVVLPENTEEFYELLSLEDIAEDILRHLRGGKKELFTAVYIDGISLDSLAEHYGLTQRSINRKLYELKLDIEALLDLKETHVTDS